MHTNGAGELAALRAEVRELRAALELVTHHLERTWKPRLVDVERDVDVILDALITGGDVAALLADYRIECRRARTRAAEGDDDGPDD
jgi:hypothetical protein